MKKSSFTEDQIIGVLEEQQAGLATADVCRRHGVGSATFSNGSPNTAVLKFLSQAFEGALGQECEAEEVAGGGDVGQRNLEGLLRKMVTPGVKRDAVAHAQVVFAVSERRACEVVGIARRRQRYVSRRPDDVLLRTRLRALAAERRRFRNGRLGYLLKREGF